MKHKGWAGLEIATKQFGTISIDENNIITMPKGIPGFLGKRRFVLLDHENLAPFFSFQSVEDPGLNFILMDPFSFYEDYSFDAEKTFEELGWDKSEMDSLFVYVIINASGGSAQKITANLMGPILINTARNEGVQIILADGSYSHKYPVFKK